MRHIAKLLSFLLLMIFISLFPAFADTEQYPWKYPSLADKYTYDTGVVTLTSSDENTKTYTVKSTQTTTNRCLYSRATVNKLPANHKYFMQVKLKSNFTSRPYLRYPVNNTYENLFLETYTQNEWSVGSKFVIPTTEWTIHSPSFGILPENNKYYAGETITVDKDNFITIFDLTEIFGAGNEPTTLATAKQLLRKQIKIATTKYNEEAFAGLVTTLNEAITKVTNIVDTTVAQANSIGTLATTKQDRPADGDCPEGRKCLLVTGTDGKPHWYLIQE